MISIRTAVSILTVCLFPAAMAHALTNRPMAPGGSPRMPFAFAENRGQADPRVRYIGTGPEFKAWFEDRGFVLQQGRTSVKVTFEGIGSPKGISADSPIGARANYLHGNDPRHWQTDLPLFAALHYTGIWPGIDLTYKAEQSRLKAEYVVAPGASVDLIRLRFGGDARIQSDGALRIHGAGGDFIEEKPVLYQSVAGKRIEVAGGFKRRAGGAIGFEVSDYDRTLPLVVDPAILFSGYFGGSSEDNITAVGIDSSNNVVVAGWTISTDLPATGFRTTYSGGVDAFVASFLPNGGNLNYCTYLGGSGDDRAFGLALDSSRNVYLTGWTSSVNFPLAGAIQTRLGGSRDAFVTKLNATGTALVYSTYLGGSGVDVGYAISIDNTNSAAIVGDTTSPNLPVNSTAFQKRLGGGQDVFIAKLLPAGNGFEYLSYLGGSGLDHGSSIVLGPWGAAYIGGYTWSSNFPTASNDLHAGPYQTKSGGGQDGFFAKISIAGQLAFSSYFGGSGGSVGAPEEVNAIYSNGNGYLVIAGTTSSPDFPVTAGAFQTTLGGQTDGFIARFSPQWALLSSTYLGGSLSDGISAMAVDFHGDMYVTGATNSPDFPVQRPFQSTEAGSMDAFAMKLNTALSPLFGTYLGGSGSEGGNAIAVDSQTSMVVAGQTDSGDFPVSGSLQSSEPSVLSSFLTKIAPNFMTAVAYVYQSQLWFTSDPWHVSSYVQSGAYGLPTDLPIVADWDGSGKKRIGIFRSGTWILDVDGNGVLDAQDKTVTFGQAGDIPVVGDWTGTGHIALGLFRSGTFILDLSGHLTGIPTGQSDASFAFGQATDIPIVADWNGSGTTKVGIFRSGLWQVDYNGDRVFNGLDRSYTYGQAGDLPVVGDWDSSGNPPKIGIYRAGLWVLDYDGDTVWTVPFVNEMVLGFGASGYSPLVF